MLPWESAVLGCAIHIHATDVHGAHGTENWIRAILFLGIELFGVEAVDHGILDLVGVGEDVGGIHPQDVSKIVDSGYVVVTHSRFDDVLPLVVKEGAIEYARQWRRA